MQLVDMDRRFVLRVLMAVQKHEGTKLNEVQVLCPYICSITGYLQLTLWLA